MSVMVKEGCGDRFTVLRVHSFPQKTVPKKMGTLAQNLVTQNVTKDPANISSLGKSVRNDSGPTSGILSGKLHFNPSDSNEH